MQIFHHKSFKKHYKKLDLKHQKLVDEAIGLFCSNPFDPKLRNHSLKGKYKGLNSINAGSDLRIIFKQNNNYYLIFFITIGSHSRLY